MILTIVVVLLVIALVIAAFGAALYTLVPGLIELDKYLQERKRRKKDEQNSKNH